MLNRQRKINKHKSEKQGEERDKGEWNRGLDGGIGKSYFLFKLEEDLRNSYNRFNFIFNRNFDI